ncbi:hypothetical protein [Plantactinospora endophytica]|uniref:Uncharacterized protein n=1 Tax=Plantactinospora endophytica TaxID=673535 RepID=A0ABQ4E5U6_9ACTN|nr:hypothetical protein [Plantactinospora endophytica]GIG90065.1 hypothetical protein Pen02_50010 [Plantactinospora endophytica]
MPGDGRGRHAGTTTGAGTSRRRGGKVGRPVGTGLLPHPASDLGAPVGQDRIGKGFPDVGNVSNRFNQVNVIDG